jgi:2-alkyl-3-oxoalkanoate reductase
MLAHIANSAKAAPPSRDAVRAYPACVRIFVAGGTGAIGRPLVAALVAGGHEVVVFSRHAERIAALGLENVVPSIGDAFDAGTLGRAVREARPDVVVNQLTNLAQTANPLEVARGFATTSRLRNEVAGVLATAARHAGARRIVAQSISFAYRPGPGVRTEDDPLWTDAPRQIGKLTGSLATLEQATLHGNATGELEGVVLRYGTFYGPGTYFAPGGMYVTMLAKRVLPIAGDGGGLFGFVHLHDATTATVRALDGPVGVYNVVDDVPAPSSEWMPFAADVIGAKTPWHVPEALARVGAGRFLAYLMCDQPAVSNARARGELGWEPQHPDWHEGLRGALTGS